MCFPDVDEMAAEFADTNGDLPTAVTADGFEATPIAGVPSPYLNLVKAMTCPIQRGYMSMTFGALNTEDQDAYIAANDLIDLSLVAMLIDGDLDGFAEFFYMTLDGAVNGARTYIRKIRSRVQAEVPANELVAFSDKGEDRLRAVRFMEGLKQALSKVA